MEKKAVKITSQDNVAVAAENIAAGDIAVLTEGNETITMLDDVNIGHKLAIAPIAKGENIIKYGVIIARATTDIAPGNWVHTHNVEDITEELCAKYTKQFREGGV